MSNTSPSVSAEAREGDLIKCQISDAFAAWMSAAPGSIIFTTYQAGKVGIIGWDGRQVTMLMRQFDKPLGIAIEGESLAVATRHSVVVLANAPLLSPDFNPEQTGRYDALYVPRAAYFTGDLNAHDLAFGSAGLWVVNTRFCCLCSLSQEYSFVPAWRPPFVTDTVPEDRCHLNGLAMVEGKPRFVTALGETDTPGGWREGKAHGGIVVEVDSGQILARGLSMPHSPRWHNGKLWVLNSGAGELCVLDPASGKVTVVCALPGYLRGLGFAGPFALVALSQIRERHIFGNLPVQEKHRKLLCGIAAIDLRSGRQVAMLEFTSGCQELFEVQFLPGVRRPMILNQEREESRQAFTAPDFSYWLRPRDEISGAHCTSVKPTGIAGN